MKDENAACIEHGGVVSRKRRIVGPEKGLFFNVRQREIKLFLHEFYVPIVYPSA